MKAWPIIIALLVLVGVIFLISSGSSSILSAFPPLKAVFGDKTQKAPEAIKLETSNIFRSVDEGKIWFPQAAINADANIGNIPIYKITFDPTDSNIVYACTVSGLYKTVNNGQNWDRIFDRNEILVDGAPVLNFAQDRRNPDRMYIAAYQNLRGVFLKSEDGGLSFIQTYITELDKYFVSSIAIDPDRSNVIYIGTSQGGFFTSKDYGETWKATYWITGNVTNIVINPRSTNEIYAITSDRGMFVSKDYGESWTSLSKELSRVSARNQPTSFQIDNQDPRILYLAVTNGLLKSEDEGKTWRFIDLLIPKDKLPVDAVVVDPYNRNNVYVGVKDLIYKSEDAGENWSVQRIKLPAPSQQNAPERRIGTIVVDQKDTKSIYIGIK